MIEVIKVTPRGYCYGVVDAMKIVRQAAANPALPRPIYIVGLIVHNHIVVEELTRLGVTTLDGGDRATLLEQVTCGTVIFTAHGVSPAVKQRAYERGLEVVDATCPDIARTHQLVAQLVAKGFQIIYVGKKGHPEPEGVLGVAPRAIFLVETEEDLATLPEHLYTAQQIAVTTQTTLSQWDTARLLQSIKERFPHAEIHNEICHATQIRQEAVARMARGADLTVVVGDQRSNNTNRLVQVAREIAHSPAMRVESVHDLPAAALIGKRRVAVTAGASTPSHITREVIHFIEAFKDDSELPTIVEPLVPSPVKEQREREHAEDGIVRGNSHA